MQRRLRRSSSSCDLRAVILVANQRPIFRKGGDIVAHRHTLVVERFLDLIKLAPCGGCPSVPRSALPLNQAARGRARRRRHSAAWRPSGRFVVCKLLLNEIEWTERTVCRQKGVRLQHHPVGRHHRRRPPRARLFRARAAPLSGGGTTTRRGAHWGASSLGHRRVSLMHLAGVPWARIGSKSAMMTSSLRRGHTRMLSLTSARSTIRRS